MSLPIVPPLLLWIAIFSALAGAYLSILKLSLAQFSRGEVEDRLGESPRRDRAEWVALHDDQLILATAVWRRLLSVALIFCVIALTAPADDGTISFQNLLLAAIGVLAWFYLTEIGISSAIAEHSASSIIKGALWFLPALHNISKPLTLPLMILNEAIRRLVGAEDRDDLEEDIRQVVEESEREGNIGETEREMIEAIVDFRTATADEVMTPRIDIEAIEKTDDLQAIKEFVIAEGHSRFPVYQETVDQIVGILYVKDLLPYLGKDAAQFKIDPLLRDVPFIPESRRISDLLVEFQTNKIQMAIVLDEYGGTAGLVTIEDVIEEVVGEIRDEHEKDDVEEPTLTRQNDDTYLVDARFHIDDLNDELGTDLPEDTDFDTVGGYIFSTLGRIPAVGEEIKLGNLHIRILEAERTHIDKIRIRIKSENGRESASCDEAEQPSPG